MGARARAAAAAILAVLLPIACAGGWVVACDRASEPPVPALRPLPRATRGYVVVSLDTLRADHLGAYGYSRPTSPFFDSLAREGALFEEAYAQFPSTLVSHMSMFTGLLPGEHRVVPPNTVLAPDIETFPEVFQRHGFRTGAFTEGGYVSGRFGFRRGFDDFLARDRAGARPLTKTFARAVGFLEGLSPGQRFLLFVHTYAAHTPYDAPESYQRMFWQGGPPPGALWPTTRALVQQNLTGDPLPPRAVEYLTAAYDAGVREIDDSLRGLFVALERLGLREDVTVIVTADHGEELQEHGLFNHTQLYREVMRVPLLVVHPDLRGGVRQPGLVQLTDLAPTLYELARLAPRGAPSGRSLARLLGAPAAAPDTIGSAWAEDGDGGRALYRQEAGRTRSLLLFDPPAGKWMGRRLVFDAPGGELRFAIRSYAAPRRVSVTVEGRELGPLVLSPEWSPVALPLPPRRTRVRLLADGCERPEDEGRPHEPLCFAFQVRDVRTARVELYDLSDDPGQRRDLAATTPRDARRLLRELLAFRPPPRGAGPAPAPPLDDEIEESLRALGYLQ